MPAPHDLRRPCPPTQRDFIPSLINIIAHVSVFSQDTSFEPQIPQKNSSNDVKCVIKYRWFFLVLRLLLLCVYVLKRHCVGHSNMPAWCFLAFSEVGIGVRLGACDPGLAPRRRSIYTTQGEGQIGMAKRDSIRGRGKNIRLTPMTPEKRRYLDQQAF